MDSQAEIPSFIGRLLAELSWSGDAIRQYRAGGRGFENVLTAEVLLALDLLPRTHFLGPVLAAAVGADKARRVLIREAEEISFSLLPGNSYLKRGGKRPQYGVQPDAILRSPGAFVVVEAKRLRRGSFQREQLAKEYVIALQRGGDRAPVLLLLLPEPSLVPVAGQGRMAPEAAIAMALESVLSRTEEARYNFAEAAARIPHVVCWITWSELSQTLKRQLEALSASDESIRKSISRLVTLVSAALEWHK
jgi:hypothetical protein